MPSDKPLPELDNWNKPFWEACKEHRFIMQKCDATGQIWYPPAPISPATRDEKWSWVDISGRGIVWSMVQMHQKYFAGFADEIPYMVIQVQLEEGPMILSNIVGCDPNDVKIGMTVKIVFDDTDPNISLPKFAPVELAPR